MGAEASIAGLDDDDVRVRVERGEVNDVPRAPTRTLLEIARANVLTRFNALLGGLLFVIIVVGPFQDALFGFVLVSNTLIGIVQEIRAKSTLDRLALLSAPKARVVRGGEVRDLPPEELVLDDVLELRPGDQLPVDGIVLTGDLEVDESLLSGESEPVARAAGDEVLSGSFVTAGAGRYRATRVGRAAYAQDLAEQARRFTLVRSELRDGINRILFFVTWAIVPTAILLVTSQLQTTDLEDAIRGSVAGVGSMVPEGLVLLTSIAFAVAVVRLGRRRVLVQELPAVETLARVDVVCLDKTGTLTEGDMVVDHIERLIDGVPVEEALGALAAADSHPNASLRAIGTAFAPPDGWTVATRVPFSSARKWGAVTFTGKGTWVLGAVDVLRRAADDTVVHQAEEHSRAGRRVLLVARADDPVDWEEAPPDLEPAALVVLSERIRPDAAETLSYFAAQGVAVKIISGDSPRTVGAIAGQVGVVGADDPVDARDLPEEPDRLGEVLDRHSVFGRVQPHQKRAMVAALQRRGRIVGMTGDGVNDVLALKDADIGVAMGSGSSAARGVAQLVLLDNAFAELPGVVAEGRRVIANVERVANLFVTKTVYAMLLSLAVGVAGLPFPFLPRHLTIVSSLTIGIPAFFLALAPNAQRFRAGFVVRVLRFAVPTGLVAAAATFSAYAIAHGHEGVSLIQTRTTATLVLFSIGLWVLTILARPLTGPREGLAAAMAAAFVVALAVPRMRSFYALRLPPPVIIVAAALIVALAGTALEAGWRIAGWLQRRRSPPGRVTPP